jgi:hypothetical protein
MCGRDGRTTMAVIEESASNGREIDSSLARL